MQLQLVTLFTMRSVATDRDAAARCLAELIHATWPEINPDNVLFTVYKDSQAYEHGPRMIAFLSEAGPGNHSVLFAHWHQERLHVHSNKQEVQQLLNNSHRWTALQAGWCTPAPEED